MPFTVTDLVKRISEDTTGPKATGPKAFCSGTLLPCTAGTRCRHFGVHSCSTYKKHKKNPCPHFPDKGFVCTRID